MLYMLHIFGIINVYSKKGNKMTIYMLLLLVSIITLALVIYVEIANKRELQEHKRKYYGGIK